MVVNPRRIEFRSYKAMASHLNKWASRRLVSPDAWEEALTASRDWLDYSGRNQVLLASYESVDGPVAGVETWRLVPSTTPDRSCAVRGGEHGWPIRVPITTGGNEPDPYLGGTRPTKSETERWEWRSVFSIDQLARRPLPDALTPQEVPGALTGPNAEEAWLDAVRKVASTTVRGQLPRSSDPQKLLVGAARRVSVRSKSTALEPAQLEQAAWLVANRVGQAPGDLPAWDPEPYRPQDRWQMLVNVLDTSRKLTGSLGVVIGADLTDSPLPKMDIVDDRVVPADAARRLPKATFEKLPVGEWVTVGPYSASEWAAWGERGSGAGSYLRLNTSAYLVAVEDGAQTGWRLHDVAERTGHGLLANGTAQTLDEAKQDAYLAVRDRYPALARPEQPMLPEQLTTAASAPVVAGASPTWEPIPGQANTSAQQCRLSEQIVLYAFPGPGGRWLPAVHEGGSMTHLPYTKTLDDAQASAGLAGRRAARLAMARSPAVVDRAIADMIAGGDYSRAEVCTLTDHHLRPVDQERLAAPDVTPDDLVDLLGAMGATPTTTALALHAEGVDADEAARLLPVVGVPMDRGIRLLHDHWDIPRVSAAEALGATATEMRSAGCTTNEIMATRSRDVLRALPDDPRAWELAAGAMGSAGHTPARAVSHLVAHAPSPEAFAAGLDAATAGDPRQGFALTSRYGAQGEHLAAASERYGLSPTETATLLADTGTAPAVDVETLHHRCEGDAELIARLAEQHLGIPTTDTHDHLTTVASPARDPVSAGERVASLDPTDPDALLRLLPDPGPATETDVTAMLELVPDPQPAVLDTHDIGGPS